MASDQRRQDEARIRRLTRRLAYGAVAATAVFGGLAAAASHQSSTTGTDESTQLDSDTTSQGFGAPTQSSQPPVAQSGGS